MKVIPECTTAFGPELTILFKVDLHTGQKNVLATRI